MAPVPTPTTPRAPASSHQKLIAGLSFGLILGGSVGSITLMRSQRSVIAHPWPFVALVAIFLAGETLYIELDRPGATRFTYVMSSSALVACLVLGHPNQLVLAHAVALGVRFAAYRRAPSIKFFFNVGQVLAADLVALLIFYAFKPHVVLSWQTAIGGVLAALVCANVGAALVGLAVKLSGGQSSTTHGLNNFAIATAAASADGVFAIEALFLGHVNLLLVPLAVLPLVVLRFAYQNVKVQQVTSDKAEFLYQATVALHQEKNLDDGLLGVLERTREIINCQTATVVLLVVEGAVTCGAVDGVADHHSMTAAPVVLEDATRTLATQIDTATLVPRGSRSLLAGPLSVFGRGDAIVARLTRDNESAGILVVTRPREAIDRFLGSDVELVEVLAGQISLALEKGFLEQSLHQLLELEGQLSYQAFHDGLTGLANRTRFNEQLRADMTRVGRASLAVLLLDVDDFKMVNDSFGHGTGDRLLEEVARRITESVGNDGLTARLGGDEFAILLHDAHIATAMAKATKILDNVNQPLLLETREISVGASIGIAISDGFPEEPADVLRNSDLALYRAKGTGKGKFATYEESMHLEVRERVELSAALTNAVERNELIVAYQPIHDLWNGDLVGVEALVRWRHPELGELLPASFLSITEDTGQIVEIGKFVLRTALADAASWESTLRGRPFTISVNVSGRQLRDDDFEATVLRLVREANLSDIRLTLEITESIFITDAERAAATLRRLSLNGIALSLDDFGTGYSSLSQLHRFPMDQVKIDRSFVSRLDEGPDEATMVNAILQLARALRMETVAEGIETAEQLGELRRLGCRRGQGWLLGRPTTRAHIEELLEAGNPASSWALTR